MRVIDLTGKKFNRWTVLKRAENTSRGESQWLCQCDCGNQKIVRGYTLTHNLSKSCGCLQKEKASQNNFIDITGQQFGHLTVLEYSGVDNNRKVIWKCQCDCPAQTIILARGTDLRSGKIISCGCVKSKGEQIIATLLSSNNIPFEKEKTFDTCRFPDTNALARFDFWVNNQYLIEYDGIQHFQLSGNWNNVESLQIYQQHDEYKNQWCKENNIPLIRISYKELNNISIEDITL